MYNYISLTKFLGCLSESLTSVEIIKSHMALKHGFKNYDVSREVLSEWFKA